MPKTAKRGKAKKSRVLRALRRPGKKVGRSFGKGRLKRLAGKLGISGRSRMKKKQLVGAIQKANKKALKKARKA
jgi:hypothetical protein